MVKKPVLLCVAVFVPCLLLLTCSTNNGFSPLLLTISVLIITTTVFLFKRTKNKVTLSRNPARDDHIVSSRRISLPEEKIEDDSKAANMLEYQVESLDFPSDGESCDELLASDGIDLNWIGSNNVAQFLTISEEEEEEEEEEDDDDDDDDDEDDDDGNNDDDGLIEINLPWNDMNEECKQSLPDFLPESVFKQQGLMDLLAEFNEVTEEENLIEIDLSVGSIKCPMFEVDSSY